MAKKNKKYPERELIEAKIALQGLVDLKGQVCGFITISDTVHITLS